MEFEKDCWHNLCCSRDLNTTYKTLPLLARQKPYTNRKTIQKRNRVCGQDINILSVVEDGHKTIVTCRICVSPVKMFPNILTKTALEGLKILDGER